MQTYGEKPRPEWVHLFCHTLDVIPMNWYIETELHHGTGEWDVQHEGFMMTFNFEDEWDNIDEVLQEVKASIFRIPQEPVELIHPYSTANGELAKNNTHGVIAGNNHGY